MSKHNHAAAMLAVLLAAAGVVWACGPEFPSQLLQHRSDTLKSGPQNSFAWEAQHLLPAADKLQAHEPSLYAVQAKPADPAQEQGLTSEQLQRVTALRESDDGDQAYEGGKDLPEDLRLYVAAAVDYAAAMHAQNCSDAGDSCSPPDAGLLDRAAARFEKVLALPPDQANLRSVWAAYMLGVIHARRADAATDDAATFKKEREAAAKAFQLARTRAVAGASDTQGLAVASFGEEARMYLYNGKHQCSWAELNASDKHCGDGIAAADLKHAIALYASQAGHGSDSAVHSLAAIAGDVLGDDKRTAALIDGPVSQRLLVAYELARLAGGSPPADAGAKPDAKPAPVLSTLLQAIETQGLDHVAGADRLAALAYRVGRFDLAATLVTKSSGPLASWVKAKLALQRGDMSEAANDYVEAIKAFPQNDDPKAALQPTKLELMSGEQGTLALARGEYLEAMTHLYDAALKVGGDGNTFDEDINVGVGYGNDASYVAERVLSIDELKGFVDAHAPASPVPGRSPNDNNSYMARPLADNLRWLLARRLMRAGRYDEAQAYFPASGDFRFGDVDMRAKARAYAQALHDADHAWTDIGKAEGLYAAAVIQREDGMELFGYEQGPDYTNIGGDFPGGSGLTAEELKQPYVTDGERQRYADSVAKPDIRFHYRYLAADQAVAAADLVPARSQAFGALMCHATRWMLQGPPAEYDDWYLSSDQPEPSAAQPKPPGKQPERLQRAAAYYGRYIRQGAYMRWTDDFGRRCEEPDFDRARQLLLHQRVQKARHLVRHYLPYEIAVAVLLLGGLGFAWSRRRRIKKKTA